MLIAYNEDVISLHGYKVDDKATLQISELRRFLLLELYEFSEKGKKASHLFGHGIDCSLLSPLKPGWQKGKLRAFFELVPDKD